MNKSFAVWRLKQLRAEAVKPWFEIHSMILNLDGNHNRIMGLGIKTHSIALRDAIETLIEDLERHLVMEEKPMFLELNCKEETE